MTERMKPPARRTGRTLGEAMDRQHRELCGPNGQRLQMVPKFCSTENKP
jgi:hypothetical protein